jgi:hypothetical protein
MKSVRLSKEMRSDIMKSIRNEFVKNFLESKGFKSDTDLQEKIFYSREESLIFLWKRVYGSQEAVLKEVPRDLLDMHNFSVSVTGAPSQISHLSTRLPRPYTGKHTHGVDMVIDYGEYLLAFSDHIDLMAIQEDLKKETDSLMAEVANVVNSVTTTKQLVELWPSAENFIPAYITDPDKGIQLPALLISRLDEKLAGAR